MLTSSAAPLPMVPKLEPSPPPYTCMGACCVTIARHCVAFRHVIYKGTCASGHDILASTISAVDTSMAPPCSDDSDALYRKPRSVYLCMNAPSAAPVIKSCGGSSRYAAPQPDRLCRAERYAVQSVDALALNEYHKIQ